MKIEFIHRGPFKPKPPTKREIRYAEAARRHWLLALEHDRLRTWMDIDESDKGLVKALATLFTLAGMVHVHATKQIDSPDVSILRGGLSAVIQCANAGAVVTVDTAKSIDVAIERAIDVIKSAPVESIIRGALELRKTVGV